MAAAPTVSFQNLQRGRNYIVINSQGIKIGSGTYFRTATIAYTNNISFPTAYFKNWKFEPGISEGIEIVPGNSEYRGFTESYRFIDTQAGGRRKHRHASRRKSRKSKKSKRTRKH